jgi:hypothetical protein
VVICPKRAAPPSWPRVSNVSGSKTTGNGVSVIARYSSPRRVRLTLALSVLVGLNSDWTRWNSVRHGSVPKPAIEAPPVASAARRASVSRKRLA